MREEGWEIDTWIEMKKVMRKRYVPTSYSRTMRQKLQRLSRGSLTVEEYYKEMEMALVRANIEEETEDTMAHFLSGLNPDIRDVVELQEYVELMTCCVRQSGLNRSWRGKLQRKGTHPTISIGTGPTDPRRREATRPIHMERQQCPVLKPSIILPYHPTLVQKHKILQMLR